MSDHPTSIVEDSSAGLDGGQSPPILSVGEISALLKRTVEETYPRVRVRGEISRCTRAASGHIYLTLKDEDAVLDAVCWRGTAARLSLEPEIGMEVVATGRLSTYSLRSSYQLVVDSLELAGEGALLKLLEERRKKLAAEGLFDPESKKPLPFLPDVIGVVTSETGAVFHDILHRLDDRFPRRVLLWPVTVQGDKAAAEIAAAIEGFNRIPPKGKVPRPDLLIVARGGGSLEDLMAFNEEIVVRAAAASAIPLISAIGHETDTTLIDFAADERAPTPSAAAEMAVPVRADLLALVEDLGARLVGAAGRLLRDGRTRLDGLARGLPNLRRLTEELAQRLDEWTDRLINAFGFGIESRRADLARLAAEIPKPQQQVDYAKGLLKREARALKAARKTVFAEPRRALKQAAALLESFSYQRVLERGFVLVSDAADRPLDSVAKLSPGMGVRLGFHDGSAEATVIEPGGKGAKRKKPARKAGEPKAKTGDARQGKLL